jgi:3-deoxy-D-manno-octulosonic acid kinase
MLSDPASLGNLPPQAAESLFDPDFWRARGELMSVRGGRGAAWFIASGTRQWALRHFRRGGLAARLVRDTYLWLGEDKVRSFAEWRLLDWLTERGLPVPKPIAARYLRQGVLYRCDLITQRIMDCEPLSERLAQRALAETSWRAIGAALGRLHQAGVEHADLNAHNILLDGKGAVSVIDFDRGRLRSPGPWRARNLARLQRSLRKISTGLPGDRYSETTWEWLLAGYRSG